MARWCRLRHPTDQKALDQEGEFGILGPAEDSVAVGLQGESNMVEGEGEDGISVQDQQKMFEQCMGDEPGVSMVQDQEVAVLDEEWITECFDAAVEDHSNSCAVEQHTSDELKAAKDDNFAEEKEKVMVEEGAIDILGSAKNDDILGLQGKGEVGVVAEQGEDVVSLQDQCMAVEQCTSDQVRTTTDVNTAHDQEVVEQEAAIFVRVGTMDGIAINAQEKAVEQSGGDESTATKDVEDKEKVVDQDGLIDKQDAIKGGSTVESQEDEGVIVKVEREGGISLRDQDEVVEQCTNDQWGTTLGDNAAEDQEMTGGDKSRAAKDAEDKEKVVDLYGLIDNKDAIKGGSAVESQEDEGVSVKVEGEDDISVRDKEEVVEQCTSDQWGTTLGDNAAEDREVTGGDKSRATKDTEDKEKVVDLDGLIDNQDAIKGGSVVETQEDEGMSVKVEGEDGISIWDQDKVVEQCTSDQRGTTLNDKPAEDQEVTGGDESRATKDAEDKEKVVDQDGIIDKQDAIKGGCAVESQEDEGVTVKVEGKDGFSVRDQDEVVEQCTSDRWGTTMNDNAAEDQEVKREKIRFCVGYPQRPGRPNYRVYMSTGSCSYGLLCYLNHPQLKAKPEVPSFPYEQRNREVAQILELNRVGLPIRENARNCTYFMRNGACRYGKRCCFNHPEHVLDVQLYKPTGWDHANLPSSPHSKKSSSPQLKKSSEHAALDDTSYSSEILLPNILRMLLPPQIVPPGSEAKETKVKKDPDWSSASDDSDGCCSADSSGGLLCNQEHHLDYPERPDRQECPFLLKYGNCKFASSCQYRHLNDKSARKYHQKDPSLAKELMVYPDKPGAPECPFYMKTGACKFGTECKFHHPKDLHPRMQGPTVPKRLADAEEHPATKTTLQDHMDQQQNYPERPGEAECRYYMQFGKCKFLSACKFHHPKNRVPGIPECTFYMKTGTCQFGSGCEFYHPKHRGSSKGGEIDDGTEYGHDYPERPGENECFHYMKHGYCRFQMNCKYHHPADRLSRK